MATVIHIIAANKSQASFAVKWLGFVPTQWRYISEFRLIGSLPRGGATRVLAFGTPNWKPGWQQAKDEMCARQFSIMELNDEIRREYMRSKCQN